MKEHGEPNPLTYSVKPHLRWLPRLQEWGWKSKADENFFKVFSEPMRKRIAEKRAYQDRCSQWP